MLGPDVERVRLQTAGDELVDAPLRGPLAKGWFTAAIEDALRERRVDLAVHSLKDLPVADAPGLVLGAIVARGPVADLLLVRDEAWDGAAAGLPLRPGSRVGLSSPRRQACLRTARPDCEAAFLRGNVTTRLERLGEGRYDAIVLAEAGVERLGEGRRIPPGVRVARLDPGSWVPAPGQGALAVQCRADDHPVLARLAAIHDAPTAAAVAGERALLGRLGGGCSVPFGAWLEGDRWAVGLEVGRGFRVRRGRGAPEAAVDALAAGEAGERWSEPGWEVIDVGA